MHNKILTTALIVFCLVACGGRETSVRAAPRVEVDGSVVQGAWIRGHDSGAVFKGIPYAKPPVGNLRWQPPQRISSAAEIEPALAYGPPCPQINGNVVYTRDIAIALGTDPLLVPDMSTPSENCLHLNVWTPDLHADDGYPVMAWIYGGSNVAGTAEEIPYDGEVLASKGAVVVTFDYRVGVLGFLAHEALSAESSDHSSGNYGFLDQIAVLEWIQRNVVQFGGDPNRVTIFGESAGGTDIVFLMTSPRANGLFHRAVAMSSYTNSHQEFRFLKDEASRRQRLTDALGIKGDNAAAELRQVDAMRLVESSAATFPEGQKFGPVIDGSVLPLSPGEIFANGDQYDVPLIIGWNANEWTSLRHYYPEIDQAGLQQGLVERYGALSDRAAELYAVRDETDVQSVVDEWQRDDWFTCPSLFTARSMQQVSSPVYVYQFSRTLPGEGGRNLGTWHSSMNAYVFDNLEDERWAPRDLVDDALADAISNYLVQFAATGNPNGGDRTEWPKFENETEFFLDIGDRITTGDRPRQEQCELFEEDFARRLSHSP